MVGLATVALSSCSDYLDTDAPSKIFPEDVYSSTREAERALNGVYAAMLTGDTYGKAFLTSFNYNTDVDFKIITNRYFKTDGFQRYESDPDAGAIKKIWDAQYKGIERANMLINGLENGPLYDEENPDADVMQMIGEAKVLRAIFYHDLVWYFGDVPYTRKPSYENTTTIYDIADRTTILNDMINDLIEAAPSMKSSNQTGWSDGVERISQEMAWAMIARLAMTAGGYSLRPDGGGAYGSMQRPTNWTEFYETAKTYAKKVMDSRTHQLNDDFYKVFVRECNFEASNTSDDVIFEIPFAKESSGCIGYEQGPKMDNNSGSTVHSWGKASSSAQLNPLYWYFFDERDTRRGFINQLFGYNNQGVAEYNNGRTVYNGKWSKLWNVSGLGATTEDNTGFNFPYMRYADVLLMYAEAAAAINGGAPTPEAIDALEQVRKRAFRDIEGLGNNAAAAVAQPDRYNANDFIDAVLDERKFEFAGENMRWRDLVRNNKLSEELYWTYNRMFNICIGQDDQAVVENDNIDWTERFVDAVYRLNDFDRYNFEPIDNAVNYGKDVDGYLPFHEFPQSSPNMKIVWVINRFRKPQTADASTNWKDSEGNLNKPGDAAYVSWMNNDNGLPTEHFLYSLRGYINCDEGEGVIMINNNGSYESAPSTHNVNAETLPVVRYILPYPRAVITRSMGKYTNKYGYN